MNKYVIFTNPFVITDITMHTAKRILIVIQMFFGVIFITLIYTIIYVLSFCIATDKLLEAVFM